MTNPFKGDKEKLAKMNFRQKVDYIWTYYKFGFFIFVLAAVIIGSFIHAQIIYNPDAITLLLCDTYSEDSQASYDYLNQAFKNHLGLAEDDKDPLSVDDTISLKASGDSQNTAVMIQKLVAVIASGGADLMVLPEDGVAYYADQGYYADLQTVLPSGFFNYLKENDLIFEVTETVSTDEETGEKTQHTYYGGIRLEDNAYIKNAGIIQEKMSAGIVVSSKHMEQTLDFLFMIFDYEPTQSDLAQMEPEIKTEH